MITVNGKPMDLGTVQKIDFVLEGETQYVELVYNTGFVVRYKLSEAQWRNK